MQNWLPQILLEIMFLTMVFLHISKKNTGAVAAYALQSLVVVCILGVAFVETHQLTLLLLAGITLFVKVIAAPVYFTRLIKKNALMFAVSTYLSTPWTLLVISLMTAVAFSSHLSPLTSIVPANHGLLTLSLAVMLLALFLTVNRKGALSQLIGVLSFENGIFAFATYAGLEQSFGLEMGILFDMAIWIGIATVFVSMIYRHFGTLNVTAMKKLTD